MSALTSNSQNASLSAADSSLRYEFPIDELGEASHYGRLFARVGRGKRVLELGSSTGYLSEALIKHFDCKVTGIEIDADAAQVARARGLSGLTVHVHNLDTTDLSEVLAGQEFDVVLVADVLEHLRYPEGTLRQVKKLLAKEGRIVASIPHVAQGDIRLSLLFGRLPFRPMGLLDHTHIRFFTRALLEHLFEDGGFRLTTVERNRWNVTQTEVYFEGQKRLPASFTGVNEILALDPEAETYQFIAQAVPKEAAASAAPDKLDKKIEIVVFDTILQSADDVYHRYLKNLDYKPENLRFWFCAGDAHNDKISITDVASKQTVPMGESDFHTWRFAASGVRDTLLPHQMPRAGENALATSGEKPSGLSTVNVAKILRQVAQGSEADYVFILQTTSLPRFDCLKELVAFAEREKQFHSDNPAPIVCATPEVRTRADEAEPNGEGELAWHEYSGMLIPRATLLNQDSFDSTFITSDAQAKDICWRARLRGEKVLECPTAFYFSNGPRYMGGTEDEHCVDELRLRRRWGTTRNVIAYARHLLGQPVLSANKGLRAVKLFNHVLGAMIVEQPVSTGAVSFTGAGSSVVKLPG